MRKILYIIPLFIFSFTFTGGPPQGWYQQSLPNINGASIRDITFTDSLNGYIVTSIGGSNSYILKTTNGGDNWEVKFMHIQPFVKVQFINSNTGFTNAFTKIFKTTNAGENWDTINLPGIFGDDMFVLNEDTIWLVNPSSLAGGVFRTTNGGLNWDQQLNLGNENPNHIYMFNSRIGFIAEANSYLRKTTDGGQNWEVIPNDNGFTDMHFTDSLKGWKCGTSVDSIRATTDGGDTWFKQTFFSTGGFFNLNTITNFAFVGTDTIFGVGSRAVTTLGSRGMIYISTNGGNTWGYQLPDTNTIAIGRYFHINFIGKNNGWAYSISSGVHTISGGDTTIYLGVNQISSEIPSNFELYQNYPNPFNPKTTIKYSIRKHSEVKISVFGITGKNVVDLVKEIQTPGIYSVDFPGIAFSSGIYFYSLYIDGVIVNTKKMMLIK